MQLAWADTVHAETGLDVLILAPLAVAQQTVEEGAQIGVSVNHAREADQIRPGVNITNYDRVHKFDASRFGAVVLDESSIIKHHAAKRPCRRCSTCSAVRLTGLPAPPRLHRTIGPNFGNHAEFLGVCSRAEMLAEFLSMTAETRRHGA